MEPSKVEFAVKIDGPDCVEQVKSKLEKSGINVNDIESITDNNNKEARIVIKTTQSCHTLQESIEQTGKQAVLVGFSDKSAVVMLDKGESLNIKGVVRFCSIASGTKGVVVDGVIDGLMPLREHVLSICEYGDVSNGCSSLGGIYKNSSYTIKSDDTGRSTIRTVDHNLDVSELIGRSAAVSQVVGHKEVCGIISRSAGIFENWKRICACDGVTIWDERDRPLAGKGRRI